MQSWLHCLWQMRTCLPKRRHHNGKQRSRYRLQQVHQLWHLCGRLPKTLHQVRSRRQVVAKRQKLAHGLAVLPTFGAKTKQKKQSKHNLCLLFLLQILGIVQDDFWSFYGSFQLIFILFE